MTTYHGGKQKIGKDIADALFKCLVDYNLLKYINGYCEPFIGMAGVYEPVLDIIHNSNLNYKLVAGDINMALISMWKEVQNGWVPPTKCAKKKYQQLKQSRKKSAERGYLGHACSYRGRFFGTYFPRNNLEKYSKSLIRIGGKIKNIQISAGEYIQFSHLTNYMIYCDPPYANTDKRYYDGLDRVGFDNMKFWKWVIQMAQKNVVFVSEFNIPRGIFHKIIWTKGNENVYLILPS